MAKMCENTNRQFCTRVSILLVVMFMLFTMVILIWNYYFEIMTVMDMALTEVPVMSAILHYCNQTIGYQWNLDCLIHSQLVVCELGGKKDYYLQTSVLANVTTGLLQLSSDQCGKIIVWALP